MDTPRPPAGPLPADTTGDWAERPAQVALLPVGSFEQHGPHLPLTTDTVIACTVAQELAAAHPVRLLPPLAFSCSQEHAAWPGTVSLSATTLYAVVRDIARSLAAAGARGLVLVNGHGGNYVLRNAVQESAGCGLPMALFPGSADWGAATAHAGVETSGHSDMHAGELETSILLHARPELVRPGYEDADHLADDRRHLLTLGMGPYTASGVIGRPSLGTATKGARVLDSLVASFGEYLAAVEGRSAGPGRTPGAAR
ncbi:creatininase family protein [Streptomyces sp. NPDC014733]|uniref:creatininase family protein n=1 Tax=Streptomyces sp. NPDC014733 TaxID=3364885 RepID=UPI0036F76F51